MNSLLKITLQTLVIVVIIFIIIYGITILGEWLIEVFAAFRQAL